jgi:hypothetical protein
MAIPGFDAEKALVKSKRIYRGGRYNYRYFCSNIQPLMNMSSMEMGFEELGGEEMMGFEELGGEEMMGFEELGGEEIRAPFL